LLAKYRNSCVNCLSLNIGKSENHIIYLSFNSNDKRYMRVLTQPYASLQSLSFGALAIVISKHNKAVKLLLGQKIKADISISPFITKLP